MGYVNVYDLFRGKIYLGPDLINFNRGLTGYYSGARSGRAVIDLTQTFSRLRIASSVITDFSFKVRGTVGFVPVLKYSLIVTRGDERILNYYSLFFGVYAGYSRLTILPYKFGILTNYKYVFGTLLKNQKNKKFKKEYLKYFPQFVIGLSDKFTYTSLSKECNRLGLPNMSFSDASSLGSEISSFFIPGNMSYSSNNLLVRVVLNSLKQSYINKLSIFSTKLKRFSRKLFFKKKININFFFKSQKKLFFFELTSNLIQKYFLNFFYYLKYFKLFLPKFINKFKRKKKLLIKMKTNLRLSLNLKSFNDRVVNYKFKSGLMLNPKFLYPKNLGFILLFSRALIIEFQQLKLTEFYVLPFLFFYTVYHNISSIYKFFSRKKFVN